MKALKILIVEDEINSFISIRRCLTELYPDCAVDGPIKNNTDLLNVLSYPYDYDLILSDIHLEDGLCFTALTQVKPRVPVIFITAYDQYALTAFKVGGVGYVLKPIDKDDLHESIHHTLQLCRYDTDVLSEVASSFGYIQEDTYQKYLLLPVIDGFQQVFVKEICYLVKDGVKVKIVLTNGEHLFSSESLETLERQLDPSCFFRANRQFIVNRDCIERVCNQLFQRKKIILHQVKDTDIVVSKDKVPKLMAWLQQQ